ncbi:MAG: hypothetical protein RIC84_23205 [Aggregatilineales bacterium]
MTVENPFKAQADLFTYDSALPLDVHEIGSSTRNGAIIKNITFVAAPQTDPISAYLVLPETDGEGTNAGILWGHWLGEEHCNREQYLDEAVELARAGVVSVLPDAMWSQADWYGNRVPADDYANGIAQVIAFRRALDVLCGQSGVDAQRIAFVGHDYSGMYGTLMAGVDHRPKAFVFIAVAPSFFDWAFFANQPESRVDYIRQNAPLEPMDYLRQIKNASILMQFAKHDVYIGHMKNREFFHNAPEPKALKMYDEADHSMNLPEIRADRIEWLKENLGV